MGLSNKRYIAVKLETTSGAEAAPDTGDVILCGSLNCTPLSGSVVQRNLVRPFFGNSQSITVESYATVDFEVEITGGGGASGAIPQYDQLLQACGFALTGYGTAASPAVYTLLSTGIKTATIHFYMDSIKHVLVGAVGSVSFDFTSKQIPKMKFTFMGGLGTTAYAVATMPTGTYNNVTPVSFLTANVIQGITLTPDATDYIESLSIDLANDTKYRTLIGLSSAVITDRKPKGTLKIQASNSTVASVFAAARGNTLSTLSIQHGTVAGNIFKIESAALGVGVSEPKYSSSDGVDMIDLNLSFIPVAAAGNDEIKITVK